MKKGPRPRNGDRCREGKERESRGKVEGEPPPFSPLSRLASPPPKKPISQPEEPSLSLNTPPAKKIPRQ